MQPSLGRVHGHAHLPRVAGRAALGDLDRGPHRARRGPRACLDEDHYDLEKVKKRIVEYMAVRKLKNDKKGPILCLAGPPGVGKTSLGRSIARAIGRKFVRVSLGGVRDEAEIRGHRRTYVGSLPGRIVQGIKKAGTNNPVFVLDEIDKLGHDFRGDPASRAARGPRPRAEQHLQRSLPRGPVRPVEGACSSRPPTSSTRSRGRCATASRSSSCPATPARRSSHIARQFLVPKQLDEHGLNNDRCEITDEAVFEVIDSYTREAGVRNLEREIGSPVPRGRGQGRRGPGQGPGGHRRRRVVEEILGPQQVRQRGRRAHQRARASRPAWPGPRSAATSCSSRRPRCRARAS